MNINELRHKIITIRVTMDYDIPKAKQYLINLTKELENLKEIGE